MSDTWDGRPPNPERDGSYHWLRVTPPDGDAVDVTGLWESGVWSLSGGWGEEITPEQMARLPVAYLAPCLTPAEVEAEKILAREEGRIAGFEEAMDDLRDAPPLGVNRHGVMYLSPAEVEARVAAARREGIEAALAAVNAEPEPEGDMPAKLANTDKRILVIATVRATKRGIDGRIRALLEDGR